MCAARSHSPYPLSRVAEKRVWKLIERPQRRLELEAADVNCAPLTQVVSVLERLETLRQILARRVLLLARCRRRLAPLVVFVVMMMMMVAMVMVSAVSGVSPLSTVLLRPVSCVRAACARSAARSAVVFNTATCRAATARAVVVAIAAAAAVVVVGISVAVERRVEALRCAIDADCAAVQLALYVGVISLLSRSVRIELSVGARCRHAGGLKVELELVAQLDGRAKLVDELVAVEAASVWILRLAWLGQCSVYEVDD